jgi:hypothetical protein
MPAPDDSPMNKDMWDALHGYAVQDNEREERLGKPCPGELTLYLSGGHTIGPCYFLDGENGVDDQSIEVTASPTSAPGAYGDSSTTVAIAHIAAFTHRYPKESDR